MKSWDWPSACCTVFSHILNWSRKNSFCSWSFRKSFFWLEERRHPWKNIDIKVENIKFWGMIWCTVVILDRWATSVEIVLYMYICFLWVHLYSLWQSSYRMRPDEILLHFFLSIIWILQVRTRAVTLSYNTCSSEDILKQAKKLLKAELPVSLRLMGRIIWYYNIVIFLRNFS